MSRKRTKISRIKVFILSAGLGERLRPITEYIPKPLIPILGKPVLQSILEKVSTLPVNKIGINLYHKKEFIENWINHSDFGKMIELFPEDPILGTGGALKNAETFLGNNTFLVHNSDILSDIDLEKLVTFHLLSENLVTLAVHDYPKFNNLATDEKGFLKGIRNQELRVSFHHPYPNPPPSMGRATRESPSSPCGRGQGGGEDEQSHLHLEIKRCVAFTGIAVYSPEFLKFLPEGISSVVNTWLNALAAGRRIGTLDVSGCYWNDIGTPASYAKAVIDELKKNGETVYIHPSVTGCRNVEMDGYVVIERENTFFSSPYPTLTEGLRRGKIDNAKSHDTSKCVFLRNCIILPGTKLEFRENASLSSTLDKNTLTYPTFAKGGMEGWFENCVLGPGFKINISESEVLGLSGEVDALLIGTGGSDRKYYRVKRYGRPGVLMKCSAGDPDFQRHIEYTRFFQGHFIPVPELIGVEPGTMNAFFEDLGDLSLYSWLKCPREHEQIGKIYRQVIDILILIHTVAAEHVSECSLLQNRIFDYEHLRWETGYFIERFVEGVRNTRIKNLSALNEEFHKLALKVDSFPKTVIHRDFQSQNIMITKGGIPRLLDYQGARIGPPAYDVVSILWDPYYRLEDEVRERLLDYYIHKIISLNPHFGKGEPWEILENEFRETLLPCRLQRHMQALGAYGFLSVVKGKKYFLKYVPEGLRLLKEEVKLEKDEYPVLHNLVMGLW